MAERLTEDFFRANFFFCSSRDKHGFRPSCFWNKVRRGRLGTVGSPRHRILWLSTFRGHSALQLVFVLEGGELLILPTKHQ
mmetsp:Transcript_16218/g.41261  ORF Transcript_16218/g.41261 Transcript_16218/m.41261 type:complete len:81 (+) Transcript_16218:269-511(+)